MNDYRVTLSRSARKELENLDPTPFNRIFPKIEALITQPRPPGCLKLSGKNNLWRIRAGDYRVLYSLDEENKVIDIIAVAHRKDAYR